MDIIEFFANILLSVSVILLNVLFRFSKGVKGTDKLGEMPLIQGRSVFRAQSNI